MHTQWLSSIALHSNRTHKSQFVYYATIYQHHYE